MTYIVSFALGHLVSIAYPEEIDPRLSEMDLDNLPILPEEFPLTVLPETKITVQCPEQTHPPP